MQRAVKCSDGQVAMRMKADGKVRGSERRASQMPMTLSTTALRNSRRPRMSIVLRALSSGCVGTLAASEPDADVRSADDFTNSGSTLLDGAPTTLVPLLLGCSGTTSRQASLERRSRNAARTESELLGIIFEQLEAVAAETLGGPPY